MESKRRPSANHSQKQQGRAAATLPPPDGVVGLWVRYGNTALTVLLLALAAFLFVRWRLKTAEVARNGLAEQLSAAAQSVRHVDDARLLYPDGRLVSEGVSAKGIANVVQAKQAADARLTDVINAATDDARVRAAALMLRGDLNWSLANLPTPPASSSDPALRLPDPPDVLLKRSADAYAEAAAAAGDDPTVVGPAHLGMAAVAENRGDWAEARKQLEAVTNDSKAVAVLSTRAKDELAGLPALQRPLYLEVPAVATTAPTTGPSTGPTTGPTTTAVMTLPVQVPPTLITPTTVPTTHP